MTTNSGNLESRVTRLITRPDMSVALQVQRAALEVVSGPDVGFKYTLTSGAIVIGTAEDCQVTLTDAAISRQHIEICASERGFRLRDLDSRNGTLVDGLSVETVYLSKSHHIVIGETEMRFEVLNQHDEYPLSPRTAFGSVIGRSIAMRQVFAVLERSSATDTTILIEGESGTGKDLVAENVHRFSSRRDGPFVVVDCGSMQSSLVESELFGHVRGAFTGAAADRAGAFESAEGGTVFLDELGELDAALQPKLLRLLEKRQIKRLGENQYRSVDVRLIAATNRNIEHEVAAGRFREDLFYRLSVLRVTMPPLRERREDIALLARSFVQKLNPELDPVEVLSEQVLALFLRHDWPGNVRELRNVVERLLIFPEYPRTALGQGAIQSNSMADPELYKYPFHEARRIWTERFERAYLMNVLDASDGVVAHAAKQAEIPRQTFHRLLSKHRLGRP